MAGRVFHPAENEQCPWVTSAVAALRIVPSPGEPTAHCHPQAPAGDTVKTLLLSFQHFKEGLSTVRKEKGLKIP